MRSARRYELSAPVSFSWSIRGGPVQTAEGLTREISHRGVWIWTKNCPPVEALIQMTVSLPRINGSVCAMSIAGEGIVVRVQTNNMTMTSRFCTGFAASVNFCLEQSRNSELLSCGDNNLGVDLPQLTLVHDRSRNNP